MVFMAVTPDWRLRATTSCFQLLLVSDIYSSGAVGAATELLTMRESEQ